MAKGQVSRIFVWVILGLLIVGLAGFGATNFGGSVRLVGSVGDAEIETNDYARALQQELRAISAQAGRAVSFSEARQAGIDRAVLGRLVGQAALENEAASLGLSVGDETVGQQVLEIPAFRGLDGQFDREAYAFELRNSGLSVAEFEDRVRADTASTILQAAVAGGLGATDTYTHTLFDWVREARDITWARLDETSLTAPIPEPSEADLQAYHTENAELFTLAEERQITYAWITPDMILDTITADDTELRSQYELRLDEFVQPERRLVERLVYGNTDAAAAAMARIEAGEVEFDTLVEERGLTLDDIDLGAVSEVELDGSGEAVFALDEPGVVGPLDSALGPALFRVNAILNARETTFEEAREELLADYAADRARRIIQDMVGEIDDLLAGGATIEELGSETELEVGSIGWRPDINDGIAGYQEFREAVFLAEEGDFPEVIEFEEGGLFAMRLDGIVPPALQPLSDVRPRVIEGWEAQETARQLVEQAEAAAEAIRNGREMAGLDLPLRVERDLSRDAFLDDAPPGFVAGVFAMEPGEVRVFEDAGAAAIVRLDAINPPDRDSAEAQAILSALSQQASQGMANDAIQMFTRAAQTRGGISINQQALNAIHSQFP